MFGIGGFEFLLILLFAFLVFGPDKLPEIARTAGELIARFRQAKEEMDSVVRSELSGKDEGSSTSKSASHRRAVSAKPAPGSASRSSRPVAGSGADNAVEANGKAESSRVVKAVDGAAEAARASAHEQRVAASQATETFAERKARYERERQEENRRAMKDQAAKAEEPEVNLPSAAELYGNVPYGATVRPSASKSSNAAKEVE